MKGNFEVIVNKGIREDSTPKITTEGVIPVNERKIHNEFIAMTIEREVGEYLKNAELRDLIYAKDRINSVKNNNEVENSILRTPEAKFQNALLRIVHQHNLPSRENNVSHWIKVALAKHKKENSIEMQKQIESIMKGVESCNEAVISLQKELESKYPDKKIWIATNDYFDARYQIDLLALAEDKSGSVEILYLVQVKNKTDKEKIQSITETHQEYLNSLPQFIGILNKNEAAKSAEKDTGLDMFDLNSLEESNEQLIIFGLAFDQYVNSINNPQEANAAAFYKLFKSGGGILNPFIVMGILKNRKIMDEYQKNNYFSGNKEAEKRLAETADKIPFTEEESMVFYKKNHVHTFSESTKITSVVMVGERKVSEEKLENPYSK